MTRKKHIKDSRRDRHISVRAVRRETPDARKLGRALVELALAQAEADAQRESTQRADGESRPEREGDASGAQSSS